MGPLNPFARGQPRSPSCVSSTNASPCRPACARRLRRRGRVWQINQCGVPAPHSTEPSRGRMADYSRFLYPKFEVSAGVRSRCAFPGTSTYGVGRGSRVGPSSSEFVVVLVKVLLLLLVPH